MNRVLVVEDNVDLAENLAELLEELDVEVALAHDGAQALRQAETRFELALVDVGLPGALSGMQLLRRLRDRSPDAAIVLMTGNADVATA
ncbi:MAG: response regulator, partial [Myxococcota bacterium]